MTRTSRALVAALLGGAATLASAHTGHGTNSFAEGLAHPFGIDHLLAMVAVGLWSAAALPGARRWWAPVVFMAAMALGAGAGLLGLGLPGIEHALALSVAVLGAMLVAPRAVPARAGLAAIAGAALLHGLAHGAELPWGAAPAAYAAGFLATTAALHGLGLTLGGAMRQLQLRAWQLLGSLFGVAGLVLWALA